jgi:hypothetical protein
MASVVVFAVGFSNALFTASSTDAGNVVMTGSVDLRVAPTGAIVPNTNGIKPGDTRKGSVTVTNLGNRAKLKLRVADLVEGSAPKLSGVIVLTVRQTAPAVSAPLHEGLLGGFTGLDLGTWTSGTERTYELQLAWPSEKWDTGLRSKQSSFRFEWSGESVPST